MLDQLRTRQPGASLARILWWYLLHFLLCLWMFPLYRYRAWCMERIPTRGPVLFLSNHQSFLDPILVGIGAHRRQFYAMARSTLFNHPAFAWVIRSLNAIPIARGESDIAAMRRCIDVLKEDQALLVFPEGTRSKDGTTMRFATGTMLLIKRAKPWVVPVAVEGAYAVWPRSRKLPHLLGRVGVMYGQPIDPETLINMGAEEALRFLREKVEAMRLDVAAKLAR
ncbi:MAG: 1-acyl-sn-glycerol-3-phosphate acyltransferase [Planctomycetes bacterium]|nr:1-acyl-sn-glycerol-3-phosphate acyltransferase [Planctomycetota bacterium]